MVAVGFLANSWEPLKYSCTVLNVRFHYFYFVIQHDLSSYKHYISLIISAQHFYLLRLAFEVLHRVQICLKFDDTVVVISGSLAVVDSRNPDAKQHPKSLKSLLEGAQRTTIDGSLEVLQV